MHIRDEDSNTGADYELSVTRQHTVNYPVREMEWQYAPDNVVYADERVFLDFIFVEPPPEFCDYIL